MKHSFKDMTLDELIVKREEVKKKYFDLRAQIVLREMGNPLEKRNIRRQIARLNTRIYNHAELKGEK